MAGEISGAVLACGPFFKGSLRQTMTALGDHADAEGRCYPSAATIAWSAGNSKRQVIRDIAAAERLRLVSVERRRGKMSFYTVNVSLLQAIADRLRAEKELTRRSGGDWVEACTALANRMRDALDADPDSFSPIGFRAGDEQPDRCHGVTGDTVSPPGEKSAAETADRCQDVTGAVTSYVTGAVTSGVTRTVNNRQKPSAGAARELPAPGEPTGRQAFGQGRAEGASHDPPASARAAKMLRVEHVPAGYRQRRDGAPPPEAIDAARQAYSDIAALASALGIQAHALCMGLGSMSEAESLALRWRAGELNLADIRRRIDDARGDAERAAVGRREAG